MERMPDLFAAPHPEGSSTLVDIENRLREEREAIKKQVEPLIDFLAEGQAVGVRERLMKFEARLQEIREQEEELELINSSRNSSLVAKRLSELRGLIGSQEIDYVAANSAMRQVFKRVVIHWDLERPRADFHWLHGGINSLTRLHLEDQ